MPVILKDSVRENSVGMAGMKIIEGHHVSSEFKNAILVDIHGEKLVSDIVRRIERGRMIEILRNPG